MSYQSKRPPKVSVPQVEPSAFDIQNADWNAVVEYLYKTTPMSTGGTEELPSFNHPWRVTSEYDFEEDEWTFQVQPGFLRGSDVVVSVLESHATPRTFERLGLTRRHIPRDDERVDAYLSEVPRIPVRRSLWHETVTRETVTFEGASKPIPDVLFERYNVRQPDNLTLDLEDQSINQEVFDQAPLDIQRQLRSMELYVSIPKPTIDLNEFLLFGDPILRYPNYNLTPPRLLVQPERIAELAIEELSALVAAEETHVEHHVATIWLISPPGDLDATTPDHTWLPLVEQHTWWNLDVIIRAQDLASQPFRIENPAAGGLSASLIQTFVDQINAQFEEQHFLERLLEVRSTMTLFTV